MPVERPALSHARCRREPTPDSANFEVGRSSFRRQLDYACCYRRGLSLEWGLRHRPTTVMWWEGRGRVRSVCRLIAVAGLLAAALISSCGGNQPGVDLRISGPISGHVVGNQASCAQAPTPPVGTIANFPVLLSGLHYNLRFLTNRVGPGDYDVSIAGTFVALNGEGPGWSTLNNHSGKLVVNGDGRSGTLDVTLSPEPGSAVAPIRISGSWRCPG